MEYQQIISTIENKRRFGNLPGIVVSEKLLAAVGNPQKELKCIHIAGTNGKGSTAAFLRQILQEAGIKTGLFTSPHLIDFTERIQVDGKRIPKEVVTRLGKQLLELELEVYPTMFDYCLAMALLYFKEQGCDLVILETGLGGRLDSTNVIEAPLVSVITKIGFDHTAVLGDTLEKIANEKAGILKRGSVAILESQEPSVMSVLEGRCKELGMSYKVVEKEKIKGDGQCFSYAEEAVFRMRMLGKHQRENAMAAVFAARTLQEMGFAISEQGIHKGIAETVWNGRMEVVCEEPYLLIDGAHNGHGVMALAESLKELYPNEKFRFIMGVLAEKDYEEMVQTILPLADNVMTITPESERALEGEALAAYIRKQGIEAENVSGLPKAFAPFLEKTFKVCENKKTIAFGSLYFIGEVRKLFELSI